MGKWTEEQLARLMADLRLYMAYSEEEEDALCNPEHMTQRIFEKCLDTCKRMGAWEELFMLLNDFPEFAEVWRLSDSEAGVQS